MNPVVVIDQDGIEMALTQEKDFILDPYLEELDLICSVHSGLIMTLNEAKSVAKKLKNHKALKKILINEHLLCDESARWICGSLATIKTLEAVTFINTFQKPDAMKWIVELVKSIPKLKSLTIADQSVFSYAKAKDLFTALENSRLAELKVSSSQLGAHEETIDALANFLKRNNSLKDFIVGISMGGFETSDGGWAKIFDGVAENKSITRLKLQNLSIKGELSINSFQRCLRMHNNLTELDLHSCYLSDTHVAPIIKSIMVNDSIEYLDLTGNHISEKSHQILAEYLEQTTRLTFLNISNGESRGITQYFWEGLKKNTTLTKLVMYNVTTEDFKFSDAQQALWMHPSIFAFGCTGFYMDNQHPLTHRLNENKEKIRNRRKEVAFIVLMLANARKFPAEIWSLILSHITVPSFNRLGRADKLFDCIIRNYNEISQLIERGDWFKIVQHKDGRFAFEE